MKTSGSIGLGLASCLLKSKGEVDILTRENIMQALYEEGLSRIGIFDKFYADSSKFNSYFSLKQIDGKMLRSLLVFFEKDVIYSARFITGFKTTKPNSMAATLAKQNFVFLTYFTRYVWKKLKIASLTLTMTSLLLFVCSFA